MKDLFQREVKTMDELKACQQQFLKSGVSHPIGIFTKTFSCPKHKIHCGLTIPGQCSAKEKAYVEKSSILGTCKRRCPEMEVKTDEKHID